MRSVPERQLLVEIFAVEAELVRVLEHPLVAVGGREPDDDALARVHRAPTNLGIAHAAAGREQYRRRDTQTFFDRGNQSRAIGADRVFESRHGEDLEQQVADQLTRRGEAAGDEVADQRAHLTVRQRLVIDREAQQSGEDVVGGFAARDARRSAARCGRRCNRRTRETPPRNPRLGRCDSAAGTCSP